MRDDNLRLIKNTAAQYVKIVISAICGLLAVRIVLQELGFADYGIYTLIAGMVAFLGVLNAAMVVSTQRFISVEIASGNTERIQLIYSTSLYIHFILAIVILLLSETIGLYAINHWLNFPDGSTFAVNVVYQCTVFTFILTVLSVPQQAVLIAYEKIYINALIGIADSILRLCGAFALALFLDSKLIIYSVIILVISIIIRISYNLSVKKLTGIRYCSKGIRFEIRSFIGFAWWNLFGGLAMIGKVQGVNIILNLFFGTVVNASYGLANQINSQLMFFSGSIFQSSNSQTMQAWKKGDYSRLDFLLQKISKIAFSLFFLITIPIFTLTVEILHLWLGKVPEYADIFLKLMLLNAYIELFSTPMMFVIQATGKVKQYFIVISSTLLLILPISYLFLYWGYSPQTVLFITIIVNIVALFIRGKYLIELADYNFYGYFLKTIVPCMATVCIGMILPYFVVPLVITPNHYLISLIAEGISILLVFFVIFDSAERERLYNYALSKL